MEFKGTKGKWVNKDLYVSTEYNKTICSCYLMSFEHDKRGRRIEDIKSKYNALLISKAPEFYEDAKNDLELFDELLKSLPLGLQHLKNAIKERKKEKEQLIKEATEL